MKKKWAVHIEQDAEKQIIFWVVANKKVWGFALTIITSVLTYYFLHF